MNVNCAMSDLFFNMDFSHAKIYDQNKNFVEFNKEFLENEAETFLDNMKSLGVEIPTKEELLQDFYNRI